MLSPGERRFAARICEAAQIYPQELGSIYRAFLSQGPPLGLLLSAALTRCAMLEIVRQALAYASLSLMERLHRQLWVAFPIGFPSHYSY